MGLASVLMPEDPPVVLNAMENAKDLQGSAQPAHSLSSSARASFISKERDAIHSAEYTVTLSEPSVNVSSDYFISEGCYRCGILLGESTSIISFNSQESTRQVCYGHFYRREAHSCLVRLICFQLPFYCLLSQSPAHQNSLCH